MINKFEHNAINIDFAEFCKIKRSELLIIIPAFNEQASIAGVIESAQVYGDVLVVDDCSTDKTLKISCTHDINVVSLKENQGYNDTLYIGLVWGYEKKYKYLITMDADGQHDSKNIIKILNLLKGGNIVVLSVRNKMARTSEKLYSIYTSFLYGINDPLSGLKGYNKEIFEKGLQLNSFDSAGTQIAIIAARKRLQFSQVPYEVKERFDYSRFGNIFMGNLKIIKSLIHIIFMKS